MIDEMLQLGQPRVCRASPRAPASARAGDAGRRPRPPRPATRRAAGAPPRRRDGSRADVRIRIAGQRRAARPRGVRRWPRESRPRPPRGAAAATRRRSSATLTSASSASRAPSACREASSARRTPTAAGLNSAADASASAARAGASARASAEAAPIARSNPARARSVAAAELLKKVFHRARPDHREPRDRRFASRVVGSAQRLDQLADLGAGRALNGHAYGTIRVPAAAVSKTGRRIVAGSEDRAYCTLTTRPRGGSAGASLRARCRTSAALRRS